MTSNLVCMTGILRCVVLCLSFVPRLAFDSLDWRLILAMCVCVGQFALPIDTSDQRYNRFYFWDKIYAERCMYHYKLNPSLGLP